MKTVPFRIPDDLNERELVLELTSLLCEKGIMSSGQAAELAGVTKREFQEQAAPAKTTLPSTSPLR